MSIQFPSSPTLNQEYTFNNKTWSWNGLGWTGVLEDYIRLSIDARPDSITAGKKETKIVPYNCNFVKWYILSQEIGTIQFDIKKLSINNDNSTSITNSNYPVLNNNTFSFSNISTWNSINQNDILEFIVTNNENIKHVEFLLITRRIR